MKQFKITYYKIEDGNPNDCQIILRADFDTNLDCDTYRDAVSIEPKSRYELLVLNAKFSALKKLIGKYNILDTYRHNKKKYSEKSGYTSNPRRNPSRIDYILISKILANKTLGFKVEISPKIEMNSDHNYHQLYLYIKQRRQ